MLVFILDPAQRGVELRQQIRMFFADRKIEIRGSDFPDRYGGSGIPVGIQGNESVKLSFGQKFQRLFFRTFQFDQSRRYAVFLCPAEKEIFLDASFCDTDLFPIQGINVFNGNDVVKPNQQLKDLARKKAMRNFAKLESEHVFVEDFLDDDENSEVPEDFYPVKKNNNNNGFYFN